MTKLIIWLSVSIFYSFLTNFLKTNPSLSDRYTTYIYYIRFTCKKKAKYCDQLITRESCIPVKMTKFNKISLIACRPMAGNGLPPLGGNFVDHIFLEAQCPARILQHVSPLTMAALSCNSLLHTLPYKLFDN